MTPKQKYDERRRLQAERKLKLEQDWADDRFEKERTDEIMVSFGVNLARIADGLEVIAAAMEAKVSEDT